MPRHPLLFCLHVVHRVEVFDDLRIGPIAACAARVVNNKIFGNRNIMGILAVIPEMDTGSLGEPWAGKIVGLSLFASKPIPATMDIRII